MIKSPLAWVGGKSRLRKEIMARFPKHRCYVEVFAGGLSVLFGKEPSKVEVANDINGDLINFWTQAQLNPDGFCKMAKKLLVSRELFTTLLKIPPSLMEPMPRAVRFFYLIKTSFGSKGETFGVSASTRPNFNPETLREALSRTSDRLARVTVERLDFEACVRRYDRPKTLFYLDPPYYQQRSYYEHDFNLEDHERLAKRLKSIDGMWLLSYNDCPEVRDWYEGFTIEKLTARYTVGGADKKTVGHELLISNY